MSFFSFFFLIVPEWILLMFITFFKYKVIRNLVIINIEEGTVSFLEHGKFFYLKFIFNLISQNSHYPRSA